MLYLYAPNSYPSVDNRLRDLFFLARGERVLEQDIAILTIDEKSLQALGQWPWERIKIAEIIHNLDQAGALIIGLDVFFVEADKSSPDIIAQKYQLSGSIPANYDKIFAQVLANTPTLLGYIFDLDNPRNTQRQPKLDAEILTPQSPNSAFLPQAKGITSNLPLLQEQAMSEGFLNNIPDESGVIRSVPLLIEYQGQAYPSMAMEIYRLINGSPAINIHYQEDGISHLKLIDENISQIIPTDKHGRLFLNYLGGKESFPYISAIDVLNKQFDPSQVEGKIILVGATAVGLLDLRATPFDNTLPGVEVHATALENMLNGNFLQQPEAIKRIDVSLMLIIGLSLATLYLFMPSWLVLLTMLGAGFGIYFGLSWMLFERGLIINILFPYLSLILVTIGSTLAHYFLETRQKNLIKANFAEKVSPAVVEEILKHAGDDILIAQEKEITIFFSDVRSFTNISEQLGSPTKLIELLNIYMTPMVDEITKTQGTVDKFIGDAIMAYWNAPHQVENHADQAVSSAIMQIKQLEKINQQLQQKFQLRIDIGIGINTGVATVGEMGSSGRSDYTIIGDAVNLASRLEGLNKMYGSKIIISEFTLAQLKQQYIIREIDLVQVKGKQQPVKIYEVVGFGDEQSIAKATQQAYEEALATYRAGNFVKAHEQFESIYSHNPEALFELYIERCDFYLHNPPKDFNGVFIQTTK